MEKPVTFYDKLQPMPEPRLYTVTVELGTGTQEHPYERIAIQNIKFYELNYEGAWILLEAKGGKHFYFNKDRVDKLEIEEEKDAR